MGKLLVIVGGSLLLLGAALVIVGKVPGLGRLPGDIVVHRGNFTLYFPLATMIVVSVVLSILLTIVVRLFR